MTLRLWVAVVRQRCDDLDIRSITLIRTIWLDIHTNIKTYIHTYKHTYIHTYKHTYIHTYILGVLFKETMVCQLLPSGVRSSLFYITILPCVVNKLEHSGRMDTLLNTGICHQYEKNISYRYTDARVLGNAYRTYFRFEMKKIGFSQRTQP
jgi:hypothetical protein